MSRLGLRYQAQRQVVAEYQATIDESDSRPNVRRPLVIGLIGAVYTIFSGVIWAAYHEFGDRSLLHQRPPMTAGPASNPVPGDRAQETTAVLSQPGGPPAQAGTARPASLFAEAGPAESRQSVAERKSSVAELESVVGSPAVIDRLAMARDGTRPGVALDAPTLAARSGEGSETSLDVRAAASPVSAAAAIANEAPEVGPDAPAAANGPLQAGGTASPAAANKVSKADTAATPSRLPALKPLHAFPVLVAEAMPAPLSTSQRSRRASATSYPARPSFKPFELVSAQRPRQLPAQEADQEPRRAASTPETLPEAIQALWTNLKILLAAAPPPQVRPAGGDGSDWARSGTRAGVASAGDAGHTTGSHSNRGGGGSASGPSSGDVGGGGSASGSGSGAAGSGGKGDNGGGGKGGGGKGGGDKGGGKGGGGKGGGGKGRD